MEVTLLRHGIAVDRADPRCPVDFDRPLTLEGKNRTTAAIRGLKALALKPDKVLVSPWLRCQQTARLVVTELELPKRALVTVDCLAPGSDPRDIWTELAALSHAAVLLVGHGGTLEPIAGVALQIPTRLPTFEGPQPSELADDVAYRALQLKKAGALQLDVRYDPTLSARLVWHLPSRLLRLLARP